MVRHCMLTGKLECPDRLHLLAVTSDFQQCGISVSVSVYVRSRTNPGIYTPGERARI